MTKVFISYAHESKELSDLVLNFSNYLRLRGVDSEIDQYEESPSEGWPKWMNRQIQQADYVLVVCSKLFYERYNDFSGESSGLGVKWETNLIIQQLYELNSNNTKFIPILFEDKSKDYIPLPLRAYTHYCINDDNVDEKEKLTNRLLGISKSKRPALGSAYVKAKTTPLESKERKTLFVSDLPDVGLWEKADWYDLAFIFENNVLILGFIYTEPHDGKQIFAKLKKKLGCYDTANKLRISIIEQISDQNPLSVMVHVTSNLQTLGKQLKPLVDILGQVEILICGRTLILTPKNNDDLKNIKIIYEQSQACYITNAEYGKDNQLVHNMDNLIRLNSIEFKHKKDVLGNKNDPDFVCVTNEIGV